MIYRRLFVLATLFFLAGGVASAQQHGMKHTATADSTSAAAVYTCPMHPKVTSTKPGECPECGMDLVKQKDKPAARMAGHAKKKADKSMCEDCADCADCAKHGDKAADHTGPAKSDSTKHH